MIATATTEAQATPTPTVATIDLHLTISDGQKPLEAEIFLFWPDTCGDFGIGPTSDIVLPLPADGEPVEVTVSADGYMDWTQVMTPTRSLNLVVRLIEEP